jgi:hypothetical protein
MDKEGSERRAEGTVGICNAYGTFSATFQMYWAHPAEFDKGKTCRRIAVAPRRRVVLFERHVVEGSVRGHRSLVTHREG